ncbi:HK97 gp10 family phage protein [Methylocaldum gracile]|jgi:hypothetical protein|uniref:HK97 gp10 family phage protein n=1 Tax=Methylocaldum sp. 0917 TaxID=2485163 RepID=UPI00105DBFAD
MEIAIDLGGFAEFQALWRRAPELADRELHAAMEESLALLQRETVEATPTDTGSLRKSIIAGEPQRLADGLIGVVEVDPKAQGKFGTPLNYAIPVELGTRPHEIGIRDRKALHFMFKGVPVTVRKVQHPGTEGAHMFERTMAAQRAQVQTIFDRAMRRIVEQLGG